MNAEAGSGSDAKSGELRSRCSLLRDQSRTLRLRSRQCRARIHHATETMGNAAAALPGGPDAMGRMDRLVRAEKELKSAIAECSAALAEVRRELEWRDNTSAAIVH